MTDPRARKVTQVSNHSRSDVSLVLECGHIQRRRLRHTPTSVVCTECPVPAEWAAQYLGRVITPLPEKPRPIRERMAFAKEQIELRNRKPRVFYLKPEDYEQFAVTGPPTITATFRDLPCEVLGFEGCAVRLSQSQWSKIYCTVGTSAQVPPR